MRMAKRKRTILLCIVIAIITCVAVGIYCKLGEAESRLTYEFRTIDILYLSAIRPTFGVCVGVLAGLLTGLGKRIPAMLRRIMFIVTSAVVLLVVCAIVLWAFGVNTKWVLTVATLCILHPMWLIIPGLAYGFCIKL